MPAPTFHGRPLRSGPIGWTPWFTAPETMTEAQEASLRPAQRKSAYYRMLALDPDVLAARTASDSSIFYSRDGLPRGERELCAAVSSIVTGCPVCTSTHIGFAANFSKRPADVEKLLEEGLDADIDGRWNAIINVAGQLAQAEPRLGRLDVDVLRGGGFAESEILDVVHAASFFGWANRLLLTLGLSHYVDQD